MSEIDFLNNKKRDDDQDPKNQGGKKEEIIWSEMNENNVLPKEAPFAWLSLFGGKKTAKKPVLAPKPTIDKNKIRKSRSEILRLIKHSANSAPEKGGKPGPGLIASLMEKLRKPPGSKEVLIDYQQIFNQERVKRNSGADQSASSGSGSSVRRVETADLADPRSARRRTEPLASSTGGFGPPRPNLSQASEAGAAAEPKNSFLSRFFKMIKTGTAALNQLKLKAPEAGITEISPKVKSAIPRPPEKSAPEETGETKIQPKDSGQKDLAGIKAERSKVLKTNLIKGEIITFFDWHRKITVLISAILAPIFFIAVIYLGLIYYQKQSQAKIQEQVRKFEDLTEEIRQAETGLKEIAEFQARLKIVSQIFSKHIYWTNFFKFLEDNTIKSVYYNGFSGDTSGDYSLDAIGLKFSDISGQAYILRNSQKITSVETKGGESMSSDSAGKGGVKFNLDFSILKSIFTE